MKHGASVRAVERAAKRQCKKDKRQTEALRAKTRNWAEHMFEAKCAISVTCQAALVEGCLKDVRATAKSAGEKLPWPRLPTQLAAALVALAAAFVSFSAVLAVALVAQTPHESRLPRLPPRLPSAALPAAMPVSHQLVAPALKARSTAVLVD